MKVINNHSFPLIIQKSTVKRHTRHQRAIQEQQDLEVMKQIEQIMGLQNANTNL